MFRSKDLQFWISSSSISVPKIHLLSVQFEKYSFPFSATFAFPKSYMNTKLKFQRGPGPIISAVRQGPCGLDPALLAGIPPTVEFLPSTSRLLCSEDHHLPLSDCEFSLIY